MKLLGRIGFVVLLGLGALVCLGYIDPKEVWEPRVSVPGTAFAVPAVLVAVAADAFLLARCVRVILTCLAGLLVLALAGALLIEPTSLGAEIVIPAVAEKSGSDFVALTVILFAVLLLPFLLMMLFWAQLRLAVLGWARNRLVTA